MALHPLDIQVAQARAFAIAAHAGQAYGDRAYIGHLQDVVEVLSCVSMDRILRAVGYLHDVLEDTLATEADLAGVPFLPDVVDAVLFCTDAPGPSRKERKAATYARVSAAMQGRIPAHSSWLGCVRKGADLQVAHRGGVLGGTRARGERFAG